MTAQDPKRATEGQANLVFDESLSSEKPGPATVTRAPSQAQPLALAQKASEKDKSDSDDDRRMLAVHAVRVINTAEAIYRQEQGRYASWEELYGSSALESASQRFRSTPMGNRVPVPTLAPGTEVIPGFELRLVVKPDGSGYNLSLRDIQQRNCGSSFFSDDSGLIDEGKNIGCEAQLGVLAELMMLQNIPTQPIVVVTAKGTPKPPAESAGSAPKRIKVGGVVEATKLIQKTEPQYPESARAKGIQGVVVLEAVISADGRPLSLNVRDSPDPDLTAAAMDAVRQWRYQPTLLNREPVEVVTTIAVRFRLEPESR